MQPLRILLGFFFCLRSATRRPLSVNSGPPINRRRTSALATKAFGLSGHPPKLFLPKLFLNTTLPRQTFRVIVVIDWHSC